MTFARCLVDHLRLAAITDGSNGRAPFALLLSEGSDLEWTEIGQAEHSDGFSAEFAHASGLRAQLRARIFGDSRAVEVSGSIRNAGTQTVTDVTGCATLRLFLGTDPGWGAPRLQTWRGGPTARAFPPVDFESTSRQLLDPRGSAGRPSWVSAHGGLDGRSSSEDLPFALLAGAGGGVAIAMEWSGTWYVEVVKDQQPCDGRRPPVRLMAGLWGIGLDLRPGQTLPLPTVLLAPYAGSPADGGNALRRHIRRHVTPRLDGQEVAPITSFNHWFAFGDNFTDALLRPAVNAAAQVGLEYFVIDAGWYPGGGHKGKGNWDEVDPARFPDGVASFAGYVRSQGMRYGTWFEPEYAHIDSLLYRKHPDWFVAVDSLGQPTAYQVWKSDRAWLDAGMPANNFRLLDFGLPEVQQYWVDRISEAYAEWGMRWIRWDVNHEPLFSWNATPEPGWAQLNHIRGLYTVWDHLIETLPDLVIEQCATGGNRIDLGTVRRGHTFWMNDHTADTDTVRRLQTRLNQVLPGNYPNTNLCQPRHDFTDYDYLSHSCGSFGYSGRLWEAADAQLRGYADALKSYKGFRHLLLGDYRFELADPEDPSAREVHIWSDGGQQLVIELNGASGPHTASATIHG
ncbi:glycoside hydrolase family 36 protein [Bradyrhizobium sp. 169]|uniref:glycoside hydrolase family 36 protein n=1 Tax=Bradyrhizobium sp. 169 TaxID=2782640 RepID=UPI001FF99FEF|nr:glycoside hydrolase family 36 protein [Bradyrhizobium sp. 169]MCK1588556.1 alpha-galactosidase [Bradyrhizobium sp. 169]